jgi:hypothetical protein
MKILNTLLLFVACLMHSSRAFVAPSVAMPVLTTLARIPQEHPLALAVAITSIKTGTADFLAQRISRADDGVALDTRRLGVFALYGAVYLGWWQHFLFSTVYTKIFPMASVFASRTFKEKLTDTVGATAVLKQVLCEATFHYPLMYVPAFYVLQEIASPKFRFSHLASKLRSNWREDLILAWKVWIPAMLINFSTIPLQYQVPFTAAVSFGYMSYFSLKRGDAGAPEPEPAL